LCFTAHSGLFGLFERFNHHRGCVATSNPGFLPCFDVCSGLTFIFVVVFGAPVGFLGGLLGKFSDYLVWIGGILMIVFGLHVMGIITLPLFNMQKRLEYGQDQTPSYAGSVLVEMTFAAGWTPCIGPLLGAILTLAIQEQNVGLAMFYLFVYSLGLAVPFLLTAWLLTTATSRLKMLNRPHAVD
jgi:cytochrome c-type biogenesis protein